MKFDSTIKLPLYQPINRATLAYNSTPQIMRSVGYIYRDKILPYENNRKNP